VGCEVFYYAVMRLYTRLVGVHMIGGHAGWTYLGSFLHGWLILPGILIMAVNRLAQLYEPGTCPVTLLKTFLVSAAIVPEGAGGEDNGMASVTYMIQHIFEVVIAYMLKDWALLGSEVQFGYVVHHTATVIGALGCLIMPFGFGIAAINGAQAEFASGIFSLRCIYPTSRLVGVVFYTVMTASNILALYLCHLLMSLGCPVRWGVPYCVVCVLLVSLRQGAVFVDIFRKPQQHGSTDRKEE